jgi:predicted glycogen debranching enzyme
VANGNGNLSEPLTWMDSRADGVAVTPRAGLAVELQGLWGRACGTLATLAARYGDSPTERRALAARAALKAAFARRFWCTETRYPYDCMSVIEEGPASFRDPSIRPNALMALAIDPELFTHWQAVAIVERARERLLTPIGLRTLEPRHPDYRGDFRGPMNERQAAYHQGTCWVFLLGFFARAALALEPNDFELQIELRRAIERVIDAGPVLGQVAQVASGDPPHHLGGCPAQAWSVAELLRCLYELLE